MEPQLLDEALGHLGEGVEGVGEARRDLGVPEAGVVGGYQVVVGAEGVDEPAELVRRRREAVQQQQRGLLAGPGFSIEDPDGARVHVDVEVAVTHPSGLCSRSTSGPLGFQAWLAEQGDRLTPLVAEVDLRAVRALRGHIGRAVEAARRGTEPSAATLAALTAAQRAAPAYRVLGRDGTR